MTKAMAGHFKKSNVQPYRFLREFLTGDYEQGQVVTVDIFKKGEFISVSGVSRGKGFAGVMKRYNFAGGPGGHGSMFNRNWIDCARGPILTGMAREKSLDIWVQLIKQLRV